MRAVGCVAAAIALTIAPAASANRLVSGSPAAGAPSIPAWQWTATHANLVPQWVTEAASSVKIAVIDTGADLSIPVIAARQPTTWNIVTASSTVNDLVGHGTLVASLAAGFGGDARLMIVQANRGGPGFTDIDEANAITWAVDNGAKIVNLSLGGSQTSVAEHNAVDYATSHGVLIVAAAGNTGDEGNRAVYPAALLGDAGLVVGAATRTGARASFSSTGTYVDVLAPGSSAIGSGTSYAAPEVAGEAALVWAANPSLTAEGVAATIEATASNAGAWTTDTAFGDIDIAAAVERALEGPAPAVSPLRVQSEPRAPADARRCARSPCRSGTRRR